MRTFRTHIFVKFRVLTADGFHHAEKVSFKASVIRSTGQNFMFPSATYPQNFHKLPDLRTSNAARD